MKDNFGVMACAVLVAALGVAAGAPAAPVMEGTNYDVSQVCTLVAVGSSLASLESCSKYYVCQKNGPVAQSCPAGQSFDLTTQQCVVASSALCAINAKYANACAKQTQTTFIANPIVCGDWLYCDNSKLTGQGTCGSGQIYDSANEKCDYTASCASTTEFSVCDVVQPNVYFGNTDACSSWQLCTAAGALESGKCNADLVFDLDRKMCVYPTSLPATECRQVP